MESWKGSGGLKNLGVRGRKKGNADAWPRRPYRKKVGVRGRFFFPPQRRARRFLAIHGKLERVGFSEGFSDFVFSDGGRVEASKVPFMTNCETTKDLRLPIAPKKTHSRFANRKQMTKRDGWQSVGLEGLGNQMRGV